MARIAMQWLKARTIPYGSADRLPSGTRRDAVPRLQRVGYSDPLDPRNRWQYELGTGRILAETGRRDKIGVVDVTSVQFGVRKPCPRKSTSNF